MKEVKVDTSTESVLYCQGDYPVGHIKRVVEEYDMIYKTFNKLHKNMTERIKVLEVKLKAVQGEEYNIQEAVLNELKLQLISVDSWWEPSMETEKPGKRWHEKKETCQHLRPFG